MFDGGEILRYTIQYRQHYSLSRSSPPPISVPHLPALNAITSPLGSSADTVEPTHRPRRSTSCSDANRKLLAIPANSGYGTACGGKNTRWYFKLLFGTACVVLSESQQGTTELHTPTSPMNTTTFPLDPVSIACKVRPARRRSSSSVAVPKRPGYPTPIRVRRWGGGAAIFRLSSMRTPAT